MLILLFLLLMMINISFLTIFERYLISLSQNRLGPNKNSLFGFFQSFFDGMKLLKKENWKLLKLNIYSFFFCILFFFITFLFWFIMMFNFYNINFFSNFLFFLMMIGFMVFLNIILGIFSKSKYSFIGSMRFSTQSISFEIILFFLIFILMIINKSFLMIFNCNFMLIFLFLIFIILFISELNRSPFDLSEGESELVSGFNTEFSSIIFTFVFMGEYNMILFFSLFISMIFKINFLLLLFTIIFLRSVFPRFRYDKMMSFFWVFMLFLIMFFMLMFYLILN